MDYVEHQVRLILETAIAERDQLKHRATRETAAQKLVEDFFVLAGKQGLQRGVNARKEPYLAISDLIQVRLMTGGGGGSIGIRVDGWGGSSTPVKYVPLNFDYVTGTFVGSDVDINVAPTPGAPLPRVDPLIEIARAVAVELAGADAASR